MSEYYIGAICANSNSLMHRVNTNTGYRYQTGPRTRGNGWWVDGKLTDAGYEHYYGRKRGANPNVAIRRDRAEASSAVQRQSWRPNTTTKTPILSPTAQRTLPVTQPSRNQAQLSRQTNHQLEKRAGNEGLSLLPQKERRDAPSNYQPMSEENYRTIRNRNRFVGADRAMSWTGNKNLVSDAVTGVENIGAAVGNWGQQAVKDVGDWLAKAGDTVKQWLSPAAYWLKNKYAILKTRFMNSKFYSIASKVVGKISSWGQTALSSIKSVAGKIRNFFGNVYNRAKTAVYNSDIATNIRGKRTMKNGDTVVRDSKGELVISKNQKTLPDYNKRYQEHERLKKRKTGGAASSRKGHTNTASFH